MNVMVLPTFKKQHRRNQDGCRNKHFAESAVCMGTMYLMIGKIKGSRYTFWEAKFSTMFTFVFLVNSDKLLQERIFNPRGEILSFKNGPHLGRAI